MGRKRLPESEKLKYRNTRMYRECYLRFQACAELVGIPLTRYLDELSKREYERLK